MKTIFLTGIAALFLATGAAHAEAANGGNINIPQINLICSNMDHSQPAKPPMLMLVDQRVIAAGKTFAIQAYTMIRGRLGTVVFGTKGEYFLIMKKPGLGATLSDRIVPYYEADVLSQGKNTWVYDCKNG